MEPSRPLKKSESMIMEPSRISDIAKAPTSSRNLMQATLEENAQQEQEIIMTEYQKQWSTQEREEYEHHQEEQERNHCSFSESDSWTCVKSKWIGYFTGGYESAKNPQFELALTTSCIVKVKLQRLDLDEEEMGMCIFILRNAFGARILTLRSGDVCAKSHFLVSNSVEMEATLPPTEPGTPYIIIPCLAEPRKTGEFKLSIWTEEHCHSLRLVPANRVTSRESKWEKNSCGYQSPGNPQFELRVGRPLRALITLTCIDPLPPDDAICIFVCRGVADKKNRLKRQLADSDVIAKSQFLINQEATVVTPLMLETVEQTKTPFIVIVTRKKKGTEGGVGKFRISVECPDHSMKFIKISEPPPKYIEDSCEDIIAKYSAPGKMRGLLSASPLDEIIAYLKEKKAMFLDSAFPPSERSLNDLPDAGKTCTGIQEWRRLDWLCDAPDLFKDGIEPDDMQQGELGDCWFCQAVAAVAQQNDGELIAQLFEQEHYCSYGVYSIKLFVDHEWYWIIVDDYIPCSNHTPTFAHSSDPDETWVPLLEKALAKVHGSYQALIGTDGRNLGAAGALAALTGGDSKNLQIKQGLMDASLWKNIIEYNKKRWFMGCGSRGKAGTGIVATHGYSILDASEADGLPLLKLRNTWGKTEWNGDWSDDSDLWTEEMQKKVKYVNEDDGIFWMNFYDFTVQFDHIYMCRITEEVMAYVSRVKGEWKGYSTGGVKSHNNPQLELSFHSIEKDTNTVNVLVRLHRGRARDGEGLLVLLYKNENRRTRKYDLYEKEGELVAKSPFKDSMEVSLETELQLVKDKEYGDFLPFTIIPCLEKVDSEDTWRLQVHSNQPHRLKLLPDPRIMNVKGGWEGGTSAGYRSWNNPKYLLTLSTSSRVYITLRRPPNGEPDGTAIFVLKPVDENIFQEDDWIPDEYIVAKSVFLRNFQVSLNIQCLQPGPHIIFPCHKATGPQGHGFFNIHVECNDMKASLQPFAKK